MSNKDDHFKFVGNISLIKRIMRDAKRRAMVAGRRDKVEIADYMIKETISFRGRENDNAVWWWMALEIAGNTREAGSIGDDDDDQVMLDLPVPIKRSRLETNLQDGTRAVQKDDGWYIENVDGKSVPADVKDIPDYIRGAKKRYVSTDIIFVRDFGVSEGDQRTTQMKESLDRDQVAYDRWMKGWVLIRPLLMAHPCWTLGMAVDDLRDRDEWPSELDDQR
jgi:hypothetical protein